MQDPELDYINKIDLIEIYDKPSSKNANHRNVVVFGQGQFDRAPCGTGTSAKIATLYSKNLLSTGEIFFYQSILGTIFKAKIVGTTKIGEHAASFLKSRDRIT